MYFCVRNGQQNNFKTIQAPWPNPLANIMTVSDCYGDCQGRKNEQKNNRFIPGIQGLEFQQALVNWSDDGLNRLVVRRTRFFREVGDNQSGEAQ